MARQRDVHLTPRTRDRRSIYLLPVGLLFFLLIVFVLTEMRYANKGPLTDLDICKAVIAASHGRSPSSMSTERSGEDILVNYTRPTDGSPWFYSCIVRGNRAHFTQIGQNLNFRINVDRQFEVDRKQKRIKVIETFLGEEVDALVTWVAFSDLGIP